MAFINCSFKSVLLRKAVALNAVIPQSTVNAPFHYGELTGKRYRTVFLLHGLSDDHSAWSRYTSIERYANMYNVAVIMPDGGRSFYTDAANGFPYWSFISEELPAIAAELFPISLKKEDCFVAGLSMGGYGALKLALRHPERFAAAGALSPVVDLKRRFEAEDSALWLPELKNIFVSPEYARSSGNDLYDLAEKAVASEAELPRIISFCGESDFMLEDNRSFNAAVKDLNYPEFYNFESPGGHNWEYWDRHIQDIFRFFFKNELPGELL